jgi:hypothetical protein
LLKKAGCHDVFIGIESFSDETLELMRKRRTSADNLAALEAFLEAGIDVTAGFVPGFPGDSRDRFVASALILRDLQARYRGKLEINEEAFVVQPGAPIYDKLGEMGLVGKPWADEYLDIAPSYRDISSRVLCAVEGESQGLERVGRLSILKSITEDAQANSGFVFTRAEAEQIAITEFSFTHLYGGWSLATRKSEFGHVYGLIVDADEEDALKELDPAEHWETDPKTVRVLNRLERAHVAPPTRCGVRVIRGMYRRDIGPDCTFAVSPFVVARPMDWRHQHRILVSSVLSEQVFQRRSQEGELLRHVFKQPRTEEELWKYLRRRKLGSRAELQKSVAQLKEAGILVINDLPELHQDRAVPRVALQAEAQAAEGVGAL